MAPGQDACATTRGEGGWEGEIFFTKVGHSLEEGSIPGCLSKLDQTRKLYQELIKFPKLI